MSRISILRSIRTTATALVFVVALFSPANAGYQHEDVSAFPDLPASAATDQAGGKETHSAIARNQSIAPTSRLPWLAPVGHRQPHRADVPQSDVVSAWERQQRQFDQKLDRRLIICRRC
jgi:hypothetical protein